MKDLQEVQGNLKKYVAEAIARFCIENSLPVDDYRNWILAVGFVKENIESLKKSKGE